MNLKEEHTEFSNNGKNQNLYLNIMNKRNSKYHIIASVLFIISLLAMEFAVLQLVLLFRPILPVSQVEMITFTCLSFLGICLGWFAKNIFYENFYVRRNTMIASSISLALILYLIFTSSYYILYLSYPLICLCIAYVLFSSRQLYEEFYLTNYENSSGVNFIYDLRFGKNILLSIALLMVFIPFLVILLVESNFNNVVWNIGLIPFAIVILAGLVLTFFVSESPSAVYLNDEKLINYIDTLLEEIDEKKHEIEEKQQIYEDINNFNNKKTGFSYWTIFRSDLRSQTILYLVITFCFSYCYFTTLVFVPRYLLSIVPIRIEQRSPFFLLRVFIMLIISCWGGGIATLLIKFVHFQRKFFIIIAFTVIFILSIFLCIFIQISYIFGGFILLITNFLNIVIMNYAYEKYEEGMNEKAMNGFKLAYYFSAFLSIIIFEAFYSISPVGGFITTCVVSLAGSILAIFI
jgi:hypothetical protein